MHYSKYVKAHNKEENDVTLLGSKVRVTPGSDLENWLNTIS